MSLERLNFKSNKALWMIFSTILILWSNQVEQFFSFDLNLHRTAQSYGEGPSYRLILIHAVWYIKTFNSKPQLFFWDILRTDTNVFQKTYGTGTTSSQHLKETKNTLLGFTWCTIPGFAIVRFFGRSKQTNVRDLELGFFKIE